MLKLCPGQQHSNTPPCASRLARPKCLAHNCIRRYLRKRLTYVGADFITMPMTDAGPQPDQHILRSTGHDRQQRMNDASRQSPPACMGCANAWTTSLGNQYG